jgi:hypothetical protein
MTRAFLLLEFSFLNFRLRTDQLAEVLDQMTYWSHYVVIAEKSTLLDYSGRSNFHSSTHANWLDITVAQTPAPDRVADAYSSK